MIKEEPEFIIDDYDKNTYQDGMDGMCNELDNDKLYLDTFENNEATEETLIETVVYIKEEPNPMEDAVPTKLPNRKAKSFAENINIAIKIFKCRQCSDIYDTAEALKIHNKSHIYKKKHFQCDICKRAIYGVNNLVNHLKVHPEYATNYLSLPFECYLCHLKYTTLTSLRNHMRPSHLVAVNTTFACSLCSNVYQQSSSLKVHMRTHYNVKPFSCHICQRSFTRKNTLSRHLMVHSNIRLYECNLCNEKYKHSSNLLKHMKTHKDTICKCLVCLRNGKCELIKKPQKTAMNEERDSQNVRTIMIKRTYIK